MSLSDTSPLWHPPGAAAPAPAAARPRLASVGGTRDGAAAGSQRQASGSSLQALLATPAAAQLAAELGLDSAAGLRGLFAGQEDDLEANLAQLQEAATRKAQQQEQGAGCEAGSSGWDAHARPGSGGGSDRGQASATVLGGGMRVLDSTGAWVCACGRRNRGGTRSCREPHCHQDICL